MSQVRSDYRCYFCFTRAYERLLAKQNVAPETKQLFVEKMNVVFLEMKHNFYAPQYSRVLRNAFHELFGEADLYTQEKKISNDVALDLYPGLRELVFSSENPFHTAMRLALAGNVIDFGVHSEYDLEKSINHVLHTNLAIDNSFELHEHLQNANTVLYLGDNSGEIVLDKLFIETIMHPNMYFAVRGAPVLNDVTIEDAKYVRIDDVADVISNGYDAPSTDLNHVSSEFLEIYHKADVIISKGQGNLEGLLGNMNSKIFFLLMVKCDVVAEAIQVKKGDFVVLRNI